MKNQIAWLKGIRQIEIEDAAIPVLKDDEVLIQPHYVGVCGSDVGFFLDPTLNGRFSPKLPIILGHECGGVVVDRGKKVANLQVGDKVAVEPGVPCCKCEYCLSGRYNLCPDVNFMAASPFQRGALCRYFAYPSQMVHALLDNVTTLEGAMMEPLATGLYAAKRGGVELGDTVVILGAGCIGLMVLLSCLARGATAIVIDLLENRLNLAKACGAAHVVNASQCDAVEAVMELTGNKGGDIVFEAGGSAHTTGMTSQIVKIGGKIVLVGLTHVPVNFDFFSVARKEVDILGVFRYANIYPLAREAISSGQIDVKPVISHEFPFERVQQAFETAVYQKREAVKIVVNMLEQPGG